MTDNKRPQLKDKEPAAKPARTRKPKNETVALVVEATTEAEAKRSLREGGLIPAAHEIMIPVGNMILAVDTQVLDRCALALAASDDPGRWFAENESLIHSTVFAPVAKGLHRVYPLLSVRPEVPAGYEASWPTQDHMPGLHLVVGGTGAGKSSYLASQDLTLVIRWGEPAERFDVEGATHAVSDLNEALAVAFVMARAGYRPAIDSFRNLVFGIESAAGEGGISTALYSAMTAINNVCSRLGIVVMVVVNPMATEAKAELVYNNMAASVAGMTVLMDGAVSKQTVRTLSGRTWGVGKQPKAAVTEEVIPRATVVPQPSAVVRNTRLESQTIDVSDDDLNNEPGRQGSRKHI